MVLSSLYHILYQVQARSVLRQSLLITCLSFRRLSVLGKWEGLPPDPAYPRPSLLSRHYCPGPGRRSLSPSLRQMALLSLRLSSCLAKAPMLGLCMVFLLSLRLIRQALAFLPMLSCLCPFLDLSLPVCELLGTLAGVQPHTTCPCISIPTPSVPRLCGSHSAQRLAPGSASQPHPCHGQHSWQYTH